MTQPQPPKITTLRSLVENLRKNPDDLDGLLFETLIRELISSIITPLDE